MSERIKPPLMSQFLRNPEKELHSYDTISEKNCRALQQLKNNVSLLAAASLGSSASQDVFDKFLQLKKENASQKNANEEEKAQAIKLLTDIEKKKKVVANLETKLKELTEEYEKLKIEKEKEEQEDCVSIKIFEKALEYYTKYFQYTIEQGTIDEDDKFCVVITFILEGEQSKYPIQFIFDKGIDSLIRFDAGPLLSEKQHEILHQRFKESGNYRALFATLREAVIRKHK